VPKGKVQADGRIKLVSDRDDLEKAVKEMQDRMKKLDPSFTPKVNVKG